eukprot:scaffold20881_cov121-Isochrysis_galbana.AAC.1
MRTKGTDIAYSECSRTVATIYGTGIPPTLIQARGRWASDIFHIYTRDTVEQQFRAADAILSARGEAIESVFADFVQPATR